VNDWSKVCIYEVSRAGVLLFCGVFVVVGALCALLLLLCCSDDSLPPPSPHNALNTPQPKQGGEDVQYVLLDLPADAPAWVGEPGGALRLKGLETAAPLIVDADGRALLAGSHVDTIGSVMVMGIAQAAAGGGSGGGGGGDEGARGEQQQQQQEAGQAATGEAAAAEEAAAAAAPAAATARAPPQAKYLCHLEKRIVFSKVQQSGRDGGGGA
jgi:hypothetical protein